MEFEVNYHYRQSLLVLFLLTTNDPYRYLAFYTGTCHGGVNVNEQCSIACNEGYRVVGDPYICTLTSFLQYPTTMYELQFLGNGQYCEPIPAETQLCSSLSSSLLPTNSQFGSCNVEIGFGSSCSIECNEGFTKTGEAYKCIKNNDGTLSLQGNQQCKPSKFMRDLM